MEYSKVTSPLDLELPLGIASLNTSNHFGVYKELSVRTATPIPVIRESSLFNAHARQPLGFLSLQRLRKECLLPVSEPESKREGNSRRRFLTQFCPECLKEEAVRYFRSVWHLNFVSICDRHGTLLQDRCPRCHRAVRFELLDWQSRITECFECGFDLVNSVPLPLNGEHQRARGFHRALLKNTLRAVQQPLAEAQEAIAYVKQVQQELTRSFISLRARGRIIEHGRRKHSVELKPLAPAISKATVEERWVALSRLASIWS